MMTTRTSPAKSVDDLIHGGHTIAMVMTMIDGAPSSRPLTCLQVHDGRLEFFVSRGARWVQAVQRSAATVHLTVADEAANVFVALNGTATVGSAPADRERLWNPVAKAWFTGPDDPDLAVLEFTTSAGEYWDGPSGRGGRALAVGRGAARAQPKS